MFAWIKNLWLRIASKIPKSDKFYEDVEKKKLQGKALPAHALAAISELPSLTLSFNRKESETVLQTIHLEVKALGLEECGNGVDFLKQTFQELMKESKRYDHPDDPRKDDRSIG